MTRAARKILDEAMELPVRDRQRLGQALLASVGGDPADANPGVLAAWVREAERRLDRVRTAKSKPIPAETVRARLAARSLKRR